MLPMFHQHRGVHIHRICTSFTRVCIIVIALALPFGIFAAKGKVIDVNACGEFTIIRFRRHYVVAEWRDGAILALGDSVVADISSTGSNELQKTDGTVTEIYVVDIVKLWKREISATYRPRKVKKLIITCTSELIKD